MNPYDGSLRSGRPQGHPAVRYRPKHQEYIIEQLWKSWDVPEWRAQAVRWMLDERIVGPVTVWYGVLENLEVVELRALAMQKLASDESPKARAAIQLALADPETAALIKRAALKGLEVWRPSYATEVILQSLDSLKDAQELKSRFALHALAAQENPRARRKLYEVATDASKTEYYRAMAIAACVRHPVLEDIPVLKSLALAVSPEQVARGARAAISSHAPEVAVPVLLELLENLTDRPSLDSCISAFARLCVANGETGIDRTLADESIEALMLIAENGTHPESLRTHARKTVAMMRTSLQVSERQRAGS